MTSIEFIEKQVARLESLVEVAKKCGDKSLAREAEKKIEKNKQVIADLERLQKLENAAKLLKEYVGLSQYDDMYIYAFGQDMLLTQEQYELLKEVLGNEN